MLELGAIAFSELAIFQYKIGFPGDSAGKESCYVGDLGLIPVLGRSLRKGIGYPLQYSCLENSIDRGAWQAIVHGVTKRWTRLSDSAQHSTVNVNMVIVLILVQSPSHV